SRARAGSAKLAGKAQLLLTSSSAGPGLSPDHSVFRWSLAQTLTLCGRQPRRARCLPPQAPAIPEPAKILNLGRTGTMQTQTGRAGIERALIHACIKNTVSNQAECCAAGDRRSTVRR